MDKGIEGRRKRVREGEEGRKRGSWKPIFHNSPFSINRLILIRELYNQFPDYQMDFNNETVITPLCSDNRSTSCFIQVTNLISLVST